MKRLLLFALAVCFALPLKAQYEDNAQMQADLVKYGGLGIAAVYNLDFKTAQKNIDIAQEKYPNHPYAHFGSLLIEWGRYEFEFEKSNPRQKEVFEKTLLSTINGANLWLKDNPRDPTAFMALGGAYGLKAKFAMDSKSWITAYFAARKGIGYMEKAISADPAFYDAYFGLGMYEYYAGTLPSVVKILAKIVSIKGDPAKGMEYLAKAQERGMFTKDGSKLLLVEIYNNRYSAYFNPPAALQNIREVSAKYPANPLMRFVEVIVEYENKNYGLVIENANIFLSKIGKVPFYTELYLPRAYTAIGTAQMALGQWENALSTFQTAKAVSYDGKETARWAVWNLLRLGQCYDALGQRERALQTYKEIVKLPNTWDINPEAKKYIKTPFTKETELGPLPPI